VRILDWIKYETEVWNDNHEKLAHEIAMKLIWYRPAIRKRILKEVEEGLKHVKENEDAKKY
jgi:hypothetical protein